MLDPRSEAYLTKENINIHDSRTQIINIPKTGDNTLFFIINTAQDEEKYNIIKGTEQTSIFNVTNQKMSLQMSIDLTDMQLQFWKCMTTKLFDNSMTTRILDLNFDIEFNTTNATKCMTINSNSFSNTIKYNFVFGDKKIMHLNSGIKDDLVIIDTNKSETYMSELIDARFSKENMEVIILLKIFFELTSDNISCILFKPLSVITRTN